MARLAYLGHAGRSRGPRGAARASYGQPPSMTGGKRPSWRSIAHHRLRPARPEAAGAPVVGPSRTSGPSVGRDARTGDDRQPDAAGVAFGGAESPACEQVPKVDAARATAAVAARFRRGQLSRFQPVGDTAVRVATPPQPKLPKTTWTAVQLASWDWRRGELLPPHRRPRPPASRCLDPRRRGAEIGRRSLPYGKPGSGPQSKYSK
jgi:hypothetical protein